MNAYSLGILVLISSMTLHAAPASIDTSALGDDGNAKPGIGFTNSGTTRPYADADNAIAALPYFSYQKNDFYVSGLNLGYQITEDPDPYTAPELELRWDVLLVPRFLGYKVEESAALEGLDDTDYSIHGGFSVTLLNGPLNLNAQLLTDVLGVSNGTEFSATVSKSFSFDKLSVTPALGINWQDSNLVDFYYGINANQTTENRGQFSGDSSLNANASVTAGYPISKSLLGIASVRSDFFGDAIADSPIVDRSTVTAATFGLVYSF